MPYEREKRQVKAGTYYYVVKPSPRGSRFSEFLAKYFGGSVSEDYQRHTAIQQIRDMYGFFLRPFRKKPPTTRGE